MCNFIHFFTDSVLCFRKTASRNKYLDIDRLEGFELLISECPKPLNFSVNSLLNFEELCPKINKSGERNILIGNELRIGVLNIFLFYRSTNIQ